ncbi:ABC transporter ATP-binding protein [Levilactobacillus hammesii]|uniref:Multidrug abc transporter, atp-binding protein n=1 Tax=Levilactobacillus hammesii DSM 16381 TaxID=1423753 RepID=A0A0R1UV71_9LACO|nr:ABC transporter ATP-binding protein [Levilactobacillus hammesii]KRL95363.1 multidrug abc transporter, atp-binding protein [Levilactobacillus hammesii DSM 16381]
MKPIIQATQLQFSYGAHAVLKDVTLSIDPGEIIGLIGENGAGKTTLLNLMLGLFSAHRGQLHLFGQQPGAPIAKQRIGTMRQKDLVIRGVTVQEVLRLAAAQYPEALNVTTLLKNLDLTAIAKQRLTALSGGQLRRVTFALALVGNPDLLFLDEPTVGMDTNAQQAFWRRIQQLKAAGKTIVITSHYLPEIQAVADRICLLRNGEIAFQGTFQALQEQYQQVEITCQTALPVAAFENLPGVTAVTKTGPRLNISSEAGDTTLQALVPVLADLRQVTIKRESLTDIFVHLTKGVIA